MDISAPFINQYLTYGCFYLKCDRTEILSLVQALESVFLPETESAHTLVSIAFQIVAGGGVEAHSKTMMPNSHWVLVIYPKLQAALLEN